MGVPKSLCFHRAGSDRWCWIIKWTGNVYLKKKIKIDCAAAIAFWLVGSVYECWKEIKEALGWAKMLCFLKEQGGEIRRFRSLAVSLPALSHGLVKGSGEPQLTIYLPFIFGRSWFGIKKKIKNNRSLLRDEIRHFSLASIWERTVLPAPGLDAVQARCARAPQEDGAMIPTGAMALTSADVEAAQNQAGKVGRNNFHLKMTT